MNCQTCRHHLQPFLDDELSVKDNVAVLEHVTACAACQDVFNAEKRIWDSVRARLGRETCPPETAKRIFAAVREDASSPWRGWRAWTVPVAAAVMLAFLLWEFREKPVTQVTAPAPAGPRLRIAFANERTHDHSVHGEFLKWAGAKYDELVEEIPANEVLTEANLRKTEPRSRSVSSPEEFQKVVKMELGRDVRLPDGFLEGGRVVGGELLKWHEGLLPQVIVEYGDREVVVYEISGCQAKKLCGEITKLMASLHTIESDPSRSVSIAHCPGCNAVLVIRNNRTYLLISRQARDWADDWMLDRARKLL